MNVRANDPRISRVVDTVAPLGWAFHGGWPREEALRLLGVPTEKLDDAVTELWNDPDQTRLRNVGLKLGGYGRLRSTDFQRRFQLRSLLVLEAAATHLAGHYAAATALALAQIDGLTTDVMGSTFFHHEPDPTRPGYTDDITLAGIDGNLPVVRKAFSAPVDTTGRHGLISRHGILHGRDLTYATATTSTKTLVLLEALVERLARPADDKARRERRQSDQKAMKLTGFDDSGRLLDTRCLTDVYMFRAELSTDVHMAMMFGDTDVDLVSTRADLRLRERNLHRGSFTLLHAGPHRFAWWFRLPSGHHLGSAHDMTKTTPPVEVHEHTWDAPNPPTAPPWDDAVGWTVTPFGTPQTVNWEDPHYYE